MKCNFCVFIERNVYIQKNRLYESTSGQYTYKNTYTYIQSIKDEAINLSVYIYSIGFHTNRQPNSNSSVKYLSIAGILYIAKLLLRNISDSYIPNIPYADAL